MTRDLYPPIEPYASGMLDVGDGNHVYWEACGNPEGKPALVVHGGPGSGAGEGWRRPFDPERYRVVLFDQRGCGRSTPHAADPGTDMRHNTTAHLVADMERLREHLGIERWLLHGGSWGSTLALAYAQAHPERVSEIVIAAVTTTRRSEIDWLYRGVGRFYPEQWERFRDAAGDGDVVTGGDVVAGADVVAGGGVAGGDDVVGAYARLMEHPDAGVRERATLDWCAWEDAVLSGEPGDAKNIYSERPPADRIAFVRICAHYFAHGAWLEEGQLIRDAGRLAGIPGVLIHGRLDLGGPLHTAWELHKAWPGVELQIVENAGHVGSAEARGRVMDALDRFAA
ncbi:proline iminopeptidase [Catenuloplanes nepalensis]|uniref:Proline iminopeptidase n=1 Tax=Catenuloplanes nepalensis TaxID=587533 RepID=A0ABT9MRW1_9ACTN|nr:alpha/beta fold hydrolase [Catenuloplanes nepalensis]MDP9793998.1 proline iminopeptidase [Catenuloplanes nepalensis]